MRYWCASPVGPGVHCMPMADEANVTELLEALASKTGDPNTDSPELFSKVFTLIYGQMRELASKQLYRERPGHTISPTVLVHEAYLKLVDQTRATFSSRSHFLSVAALAMRRILINHATSRAAQKRGGGQRVFTLDDDVVGGGAASCSELLALDQLVTRLAAEHERPSRVVVMRLFGGCTDAEIADTLSVSVPTVRRDWRFARAWLTRELRRDD